jgi:hypothetical protein
MGAAAGRAGAALAATPTWGLALAPHTAIGAAQRRPPLPRQHQRRRRGLAPIAAATTASAAAAAAAAGQAGAALSLPALLHAAGAFLLCCAGAAFLLAAIPALWAAARAAHRAEAVLRVSAAAGVEAPRGGTASGWPCRLAAMTARARPEAGAASRPHPTRAPPKYAPLPPLLRPPTHDPPRPQAIEAEIPDTAASMRLSGALTGRAMRCRHGSRAALSALQAPPPRPRPASQQLHCSASPPSCPLAARPARPARPLCAPCPGLELTDCLGELGALGDDLSGGIRASARMVTAAEQGIKAAPAAVAGAVVPALARTEAQARGERGARGHGGVGAGGSEARPASASGQLRVARSSAVHASRWRLEGGL